MLIEWKFIIPALYLNVENKIQTKIIITLNTGEDETYFTHDKLQMHT